MQVTKQFGRIRTSSKVTLRRIACKTIIFIVIVCSCSGDRAADLRSEDFLEIVPTGTSLEQGVIIKDLLRAFQLVHRRFITPPDNVAAISDAMVGAFQSEFKPGQAPNTTESKSTHQSTIVPGAGAAAGGLFGGSCNS
jgi:hypothetical protein